MAERNFQSWHPVLGVRSMEKAIDFYVDWLGFQLDGEWEEAPGEPRIAWVSRDGMEIALTEDPDTPSNVWLNINVADAQALADEWNERRPGAVEVISEAPYELPVIYIEDPFGNFIHIQEPLSEEEEAVRRARIPEMRDFIAQCLAEGKPVPSPDEIVAAVGPSVGIAIEVLNEFPEYAMQFKKNRS
jgi:catechol 2,3-dioxygenase-like lactoylglutathione lyase family enzyme